jgi:glycosyltransferase involved in cell wall biosynthesis
MKPIVIICTHNRLEITSYNIKSLLSQSVKPQIILVVSNLEEKFYYVRKFPEVIVLVFPNVPLGAKWQHGADAAFKMQANPLIILGSDDILGDGYIERVCYLVGSGREFIGLYHWYIHYKTKAFHCEYLAKQCLGGGRAYSYKLLKELDGKVFETRLNRHLDDYAIKKLKEINITCYADQQLQLHAIKGDWPVLNPFNPTHANIKILGTYDSISILPSLYL